MLILAIETSCDETAAAVVQDGNEALSSIVLSQVDEHRLYGGVVPEIASRRHAEGIVQVTQQALEEAGATLSEVDAVAVTHAPGLIGALLVGVNFAKGLCLASNKPLVAVHHIRGHIAANYLAHKDLEPPFLCLVASGGHSHIYEVLSHTDFRLIGRTRDDAAGEAFDKAARIMGFGYPGGIAIDSAAKSGNPNAYRLPRPKLDSPYDMSFSGLKTAVVNLVHNERQKGCEITTEDLAASFQTAVCEILTARLFAAARDLGYDKIVCAGGVCANSQLRRMLGDESAKINAKLYVPPLALCADNAAMIGAQAYYEYMQGHVAGMELNAYASLAI